MNVLLAGGLTLMAVGVVFALAKFTPSPNSLIIIGMVTFACGIGHTRTRFGSGGVWR
jgi:xanthosine utilization system XapX-like protein